MRRGALADFETDRFLGRFAELALEFIGEAADRVPKEPQASHREIPLAIPMLPAISMRPLQSGVIIPVSP